MITTVASGSTAIPSTQRARSEREVGAGNRASAERSLRRDIDEDRPRDCHHPEYDTGHEAHREGEGSTEAAPHEHDGAAPDAGEAAGGAGSFGHVVARQIAGDRMDDDALNSLLSELKIIGEAGPAPHPRAATEPSPAQAPPAPPPAKADGAEGIVNRAASAYQTNQETIGSKEKFRPGMVFSERF